MSVAKKYIVPLQYKFTSTVLLKVPSESQYLPNTVSTPKIRYSVIPMIPLFPRSCYSSFYLSKRAKRFTL